MVKLLLLASFFAAREKVADFPVQAKCEQAAIGGEFLARSVLSESGNLLLRDYVAVEVGFAPKRGTKVLLAASHFTLRINGRKSALLSQTPGMVAASVKYDDWDMRPTVTAEAGMGNTGVIVGRPRQVERFPGDPSARGRLPAPPRAPEAENRSGVERQTPARPEEILTSHALPEGETSEFVRGFVYFPYKAKMGSIKSVELLVHAPACDASLTL